jgi:hypothetical protein
LRADPLAGYRKSKPVSVECRTFVPPRWFLRLALILAPPIAAWTQDASQLFPIVKDQKLGFIDETGKEVIAPQFDDLKNLEPFPQFSEGLAAVAVNSNWGYIDRTGKFVIPPQFAAANPFHEGAAAVSRWLDPAMHMNEGSAEWIDPQGRVLHADELQLRADFHEGLLRLHLRGMWGFVDSKFHWVIPPQFYGAKDFSEGFALVTTPSNAGSKQESLFIDKTGKTIIHLKDIGPWNFCDGLALFVPTVDGGFNRIHFGYIDRAGQQVIPPDFGWANSFSEGYAFAIVGYNGLMAVIDKHATPVTPYEFDQGLAEFHEGLAPVRTNKLYGYIDPTGAWVIPPQFDGAENFSKGLALVYWFLKNEYGYIDKRGNIIWKAPRPTVPRPR